MSDNTRTYSYVPSATKGGEQSFNDNIDPIEGTEADLREEFDRVKQLQDTFGSFDNYMGYMNERQDLIDNGTLSGMALSANSGVSVASDEEIADLSDRTGIDVSGLGNDLLGVSDDLLAAGYDPEAAAQGLEQQAAIQMELFQKYTTGGSDGFTIDPNNPYVGYNNDGDEYMFTGTGFVKTGKVKGFSIEGFFADKSTEMSKVSKEEVILSELKKLLKNI